MKRQLTPRAMATLRAVADETDRTGHPPTIREIGNVVGITSTSVVRYHLDRLAITGHLVRDDRPGISRGIALTDAGYAALGRPSPARDAAIGAALREMATRDTRAQAMLAHLELEVA